MSRYAVFSGNQYYPLGGFRDFVAAYETLSEAQEYYHETFKKSSDDWLQIVDLAQCAVVEWHNRNDDSMGGFGIKE